MNYKKIPLQILLMLVMMGVATYIDYLTHSANERFFVETEYYRNKIIFGALWGLVGFYVFRIWVKNLDILAVLVSLVIAVSLQTKYFFQGRPLDFVFIFMGLHFLMFVFPTFTMFRLFPRVFRKEDTAMPSSMPPADSPPMPS